MAAFPQLPDATARPLVRAARQYAQALWEADGDPNLSWLRLVGALEAAAETMPDWCGPSYELLAQGFKPMADVLQDCPEDVRERAADLLKGLTMVGWKLQRFVAAHPPTPPEQRPADETQRLPWNTLKPALAKVYAHRSAALHGGRPFPAPMCQPPGRTTADSPAEEVPGSGGWAGGGGWAQEDLPMLLHTFEHIVRHALLHWWRSSAN